VYVTERVEALAMSWTAASRRVLLGADDNSWGARLATGPLAISVLAYLVFTLHVLDLATGLHMMQSYGLHLEQNPLARHVMANLGPLGLTMLKLGVVAAGILFFVHTAHAGRARLARNCLILAAGLGILGAASNMVG
jgi:hypothetical protein